ncbi:hypothetical protein EJ08DRAFT_408864 [Tothia fuscella]|uniref:Uncharacterized protein n=1 Tax=Tothia fuscella TaxID=1048955 RepID=A0A9P4TUH1_9PEZI|nr:hypothetical protein EJ08DRAFT_408864 [Tothia fuscella]
MMDPKVEKELDDLSEELKDVEETRKALNETVQELEEALMKVGNEEHIDELCEAMAEIQEARKNMDRESRAIRQSMKDILSIHGGAGQPTNSRKRHADFGLSITSKKARQTTKAFESRNSRPGLEDQAAAFDRYRQEERATETALPRVLTAKDRAGKEEFEKLVEEIDAMHGYKYKDGRIASVRDICATSAR